MEPTNPRRQLKDIHVTADQIRNAQWLDVVANASLDGIDGYTTPLIAAANEARERGDVDAEGVYILLAALTSMYYDDDDLDEPFKPMFIMQGTRSAALSDFEEHHLEPIAEVYEEISDLELRARMADLLWIRNRDHVAARVAVKTYLQIARKIMDPAEWVHGFQRLRRAMQIAGALGRGSSGRDEVVNYALEVLTSLDGNDPLYLSLKIIELLIEYKVGDYPKLAAFAQKSAVKAGNRGDKMVSADYWALAAKCFRRAGDIDAVSQATLSQAQVLIELGEEMITQNQRGLAGEHWIEQGFQTLRRISENDPRLPALQKRVEELYRTRLDSMEKITTSVPIEEALISHLDQAKGKTLRDALTFLALQVVPSTKERLWEHVLVFTGGIAGMMPTQLLREDGLVDFVLDPLPRDQPPTDDLKNAHMWHIAEKLRLVEAWRADYVRRIITDEHAWADGALDWLVTGNSFIPPGSENTYERALRAGMEGDYVVSTHILSPLIENSIRFVLSKRGAIVSNLRLDGSYEVLLINKLVKLDEFAETFGVDFGFALRGLLAERAGANLRNNVSHGLWSNDHFYGPASVCLFPIALYMLLNGIPPPDKDRQSESE